MDASERVGKDAESELRKHKRGSGRERVLDAYASILREDGESAATLDEVAKRAEISKGGLLHHFGSKELLLTGLLERLVEENKLDIERTMSGSDDPVTAYLTSCMYADDSYSETYLAVMKLAGSADGQVDATLARVLGAWQEAINEHISDPTLARLVQLLGDGMYSHALMQYQPAENDFEVLELARRIVADVQESLA